MSLSICMFSKSTLQSVTQLIKNLITMLLIIIMINKMKIMLREGKFFGLFNIVSFPNNLCNSSQDLMQGDTFLAMMILMMSGMEYSTWMRKMTMWTRPICRIQMMMMLC